MKNHELFGIPILAGDLCGDPFDDRLDVQQALEEMEQEDALCNPDQNETKNQEEAHS